MAGKFFDEWEVGETITHEIRRTVTETDNLLFSTMTHNPQPLHLDEEFSKTTLHGQRLVNSIYTLGLMLGVSVGDTTLGTTLGNLGMTDCRFKHPVFHGDTLRAMTRVKETRISKSRNDSGIVTFEHFMYNQRDEEVAYCVRAGLIMTREAAA